jgi:DNA polymerase III epsilon subunit-like protein
MGTPFVFLDLETTGHEPVRRVGGLLVPWNEIIEVGAVAVEQGTFEESESFEAKVNPEHPERCIPDIINRYPERARDGDWDGAHGLGSTLRSFLDWCRGVSPHQPVFPIGQNPSFDWSFLTVAFVWCGIRESEWSRNLHYAHLDTRSMAVHALWQPGTPYVPSDFSLRTDALATNLRIPPEPLPHEALNGARKAAEVFRRLRERREGAR